MYVMSQQRLCRADVCLSDGLRASSIGCFVCVVAYQRLDPKPIQDFGRSESQRSTGMYFDLRGAVLCSFLVELQYLDPEGVVSCRYSSRWVYGLV